MYNYDGRFLLEYTKEILGKALTFSLISCIINTVDIKKDNWQKQQLDNLQKIL